MARERERVNELKAQNADTLQEICTSLTVPASAFGMSYARAYFGEKASIAGIAIDVGVGLILKLVAGCFGLSASKGGQRVGKFFHDIANGAFASWTAALGAEFGAKRRIETPMPAPQPTVNAVGLSQETPMRKSGPMTQEDLAAIKEAMTLNTQPAMPVPITAPLPAPAPRQQPFNERPAHLMTSATPDLPPTPQKPFRFTQRWAVDPEADMRALLQSVGAQSDPNTVNYLLAHENPGDEFKVILQRTRAPA